ncbi:MAG: hypothetical protein L0Z53_00445, partial [Acidobacteriales bacterium]|nr:hypothetical protein [Terriglobales bacterium]
VLWWFGGVSVLAAFPFVMPWRWMVAVHEWLGMGTLTHQPVVEYLARATSALCAIYGGLLLVLAQDVRRYARVIRFQAAATIVTATIGAIFGARAGMPLWWMIGDVVGCWFFCGAMLWVLTKIEIHHSTNNTR